MLFLIESWGVSTDPMDVTEVRFCTVCSGSDIAESGLVYFAEACGVIWSVYFKFVLTFRCEADYNKSCFADENDITGSPNVLQFADIHDLARNPFSALTHDGSRHPVPRGNKFCLAGTSCKDFSRLSNKHRQAGGGRDAVKDGTGTSGTTFHSFLNLATETEIPEEIMLMLTDSGGCTEPILEKAIQENVLTVLDRSRKTGTSGFQQMCALSYSRSC